MHAHLCYTNGATTHKSIAKHLVQCARWRGGGGKCQCKWPTFVVLPHQKHSSNPPFPATLPRAL